MKTIIAFVIICVLSGFGFQNVKAQIPQKESYLKVIPFKSVPFGNPDTTFSTWDNYGLYKLTVGEPNLIKITIKPELVLSPIYSYQYYVVNNPFLVYSPWKIPEGENLIITYSEIDNTFNAKWEILTGKPLIDKKLIYNSPMKKTNNPNLTNSFLYRLAGNSFHGMANTKYPRLHETQNSSQGNSRK
jgi:hypothetical protein